MHISVVIPVKNAEKRIEYCLEAVFSQTIQPFEVLVIDGNSTDKTVEITKKFPAKILLENYGTIGGARQVGLESASGEYIAFTDSDCIPETNWLENLVKEFDEGIVGTCGGTKNIGNNLWEKSIALALDSFLGSANSVQDRVFKERRFVKDISGCNCMYRRADLIAIGGFNVDLAIDEDTELNKRLIKHGKMIYTPEAIVLHNQQRGLVGFVRRIYSFGFARGKDRLWAIQVLPSVLSLVFIASLIILPKAFLFMLFIYLILVFSFTFRFILKERDIRFLYSIPIVFFSEHIAYTIGFWRGLLKIHKKGMR